MSFADPDTIDFTGIDCETGHVVLTIVDGWDWSNPHAHLLALQAKINGYYEFVESGQVWTSYPEGKGRQIRINVIFRVSPPSIALDFLTRVSDVFAAELHVLVSHCVIPG